MLMYTILTAVSNREVRNLGL